MHSPRWLREFRRTGSHPWRYVRGRMVTAADMNVDLRDRSATYVDYYPRVWGFR